MCIFLIFFSQLPVTMWRNEIGCFEMLTAYFDEHKEQLTPGRSRRDLLLEILHMHEVSRWEVVISFVLLNSSAIKLLLSFLSSTRLIWSGIKCCCIVNISNAKYEYVSSNFHRASVISSVLVPLFGLLEMNLSVKHFFLKKAKHQGVIFLSGWASERRTWSCYRTTNSRRWTIHHWSVRI